jgi:hypothetical protein
MPGLCAFFYSGRHTSNLKLDANVASGRTRALASCPNLTGPEAGHAQPAASGRPPLLQMRRREFRARACC